MNIDDAVKRSLTSNRWILILMIIILILFIVTTIGLVMVPLTNIRNMVDDINKESIEAYNLLQKTSTDVETTIKTIVGTTAKINEVEDDVTTLIYAVCFFPPYSGYDFCKNLK